MLAYATTHTSKRYGNAWSRAPPDAIRMRMVISSSAATCHALFFTARYRSCPCHSSPIAQHTHCATMICTQSSRYLPSMAHDLTNQKQHNHMQQMPTCALTYDLQPRLVMDYTLDVRHLIHWAHLNMCTDTHARVYEWRFPPNLLATHGAAA